MTAARRLGWLLFGFAAATLAEVALHAGSAFAQSASSLATVTASSPDGGAGGQSSSGGNAGTRKARASRADDAAGTGPRLVPESELGPYDTPPTPLRRTLSDAAAEDADANPDDTLNAPERDGSEDGVSAPGPPDEAGDGDPSTPADDQSQTANDGIADLAEPQPPADGGDPTQDTRPPEDVEVFANPPAGYDPLLFVIEDIEAATTDRRPARLSRLEPYDPAGIRIGSFILFPETEIGGLWTNNVLDSPSPNSDAAAEVSSKARLVSNWSRHALEINATNLLSFYEDFPSEDDRAWSVEGRGRLDFTHRTNLQAIASHSYSQEDRSAIDASTAGPRANVTTDNAQLALNHRFNRLSVQLRGSVTDTTYSDSATNDSDRDTLETKQAVRATWEFKPTLSAFAEEELNQRDKGATAADGVPRDSDGTRTRVGLDLGATGAVLRGTISIGYGVQGPNDGRLDSIRMMLFDANIAWRPTEITSFLLTASSDIYDTTTTGSGGVITHQVGLEVRHALRRYLIASAGISYTAYDYDSVTLNESTLTTTAGAEYYASPELVLFARYQHLAFDSNAAGSDYDVDEVRIGVRLRK